jgi:hypothetical protein
MRVSTRQGISCLLYSNTELNLVFCVHLKILGNEVAGAQSQGIGREQATTDEGIGSGYDFRSAGH